MNDMSGFRNGRTPRPSRPLGEAIRRGLAGRCPACGRGSLFRGYLKLTRACKICGEDLSHARADDAPAYLTMIVVCHVVGGGVLMHDYTEHQRTREEIDELSVKRREAARKGAAARWNGHAKPHALRTCPVHAKSHPGRICDRHAPRCHRQRQRQIPAPPYGALALPVS